MMNVPVTAVVTFNTHLGFNGLEPPHLFTKMSVCDGMEVLKSRLFTTESWRSSSLQRPPFQEMLWNPASRGSIDCVH